MSEWQGDACGRTEEAGPLGRRGPPAALGRLWNADPLPPSAVFACMSVISQRIEKNQTLYVKTLSFFLNTHN